MNTAYGDVFDRVISLRSHELDLPCLYDQELDEVIEIIARRLSDEKSYHFVFFNHLGAFIASRLAEHFVGSTTTLYILEDRILGPLHLEFVDEMNEAGMVITMNEDCSVGHRESYGYALKPPPLVVPLSVETFMPRPSMRRGGKVVLTVARLYPMKDYVFGLIEAIAVLAKEPGQSDIRLTIVGDGPFMEDLQQLAKDHGVGSLVSFVGVVPPDQLEIYYSKADIYVGMGTTLLEASSHGVASVIAIAHSRTFESPGLFGRVAGHYLGEAISGIKTQPGICYLRELLRSDSRLAEESDLCRRKAATSFPVDQTMSLFMEKISSSGPAILEVPLPPRPHNYGKFRRFLKRRLKHFPVAMSLGRFFRKLLGGINF